MALPFIPSIPRPSVTITSLPPASTSFVLTGFVTNPGKSASGVVVSLNKNGSVVGTTTTDASGTFSYSISGAQSSDVYYASIPLTSSDQTVHIQSGDPSQVAGLQLWLDTSLPSSLFQDTGKMVPAAAGGDPVHLWADKSGNGYDAVVVDTSTPHNIPVLTLSVANAKPGVTFTNAPYTDGTGAHYSAPRLSLGNPASLNIGNTGSLTLFVVFEAGALANWGTLVNKDPSPYYGVGIWSVAAGGKAVSRGPNVTMTPERNGMPNSAAVYTYRYSPHSTSLPGATTSMEDSNVNGGFFSSHPAALTFDATANWVLGGHGTFTLPGAIMAVVVYNRALSDSDCALVWGYLSSKFGVSIDVIPPENTSELFVYQGDSITYGYGSTNVWTNSYPARIFSSESVGSQHRYFNLGISGYTMSWISSQSALVDSLFTGSFGKCILTLAIGTNDLSGVTLTSAVDTVYNSVAAYCTARRATGYKINICTILPSAGITDSIRQYYNGKIRAGWSTFADALTDLGNDQTIGQAGQNVAPYFNADGIHPTDAGYGIIAGAVRSVLAGM